MKTETYPLLSVEKYGPVIVGVNVEEYPKFQSEEMFLMFLNRLGKYPGWTADKLKFLRNMVIVK